MLKQILMHTKTYLRMSWILFFFLFSTIVEKKNKKSRRENIQKMKFLFAFISNNRMCVCRCVFIFDWSELGTWSSISALDMFVVMAKIYFLYNIISISIRIFPNFECSLHTHMKRALPLLAFKYRIEHIINIRREHLRLPNFHPFFRKFFLMSCASSIKYLFNFFFFKIAEKNVRIGNDTKREQRYLFCTGCAEKLLFSFDQTGVCIV